LKTKRNRGVKMKGLILKDFYNLSRQNKIILAAVLFYVLLSVLDKDPAFFGGMLTLLVGMQTITALAYDEKSKWDRYALTMPVSRTNMVLSKYVLSGILLFISFAANLIFMIIAGTEPIQSLTIASVMMGIGLFFIFVILPVLFKFGVEKGRFIIMLVFLAPSLIALIGSKIGFEMPDESFMRLLPVIGVIILVISGIISIIVSLAVYRKKEM